MVSDKVTSDKAAAEEGQLIMFPVRASWEPWVDERTIAKHFDACDRTIRRWRSLGMPSRLFGGLRRYRVSECEEWHAREGDAA
jgi:hypothetical protein